VTMKTQQKAVSSARGLLQYCQ